MCCSFSTLINEMATDVHNQIIQNLKSGEFFSYQFDDLTCQQT